MSLNFILDNNITTKTNPSPWTNLRVNSINSNVPIENTDATKIQGRDVADVDPADTEVLTWSSSTMQWEPAPGGGGGGIIPRTPGSKSLYWDTNGGGSDANDGETPGTPVETWARLIEVAQPFYYDEIIVVLAEGGEYVPDTTIDPNNIDEEYVDLTFFYCAKLKFISNTAPIETATPASSVDYDPVSGRTLTGNAFKTYNFTTPLSFFPNTNIICKFDNGYGVCDTSTNTDVNVLNNLSGTMSFYDPSDFAELDIVNFLSNALVEIERCYVSIGKSKKGETIYLYGCEGNCRENVYASGCIIESNGGTILNCRIGTNSNNFDDSTIKIYDSVVEYDTRTYAIMERSIIKGITGSGRRGGILTSCIITNIINIDGNKWKWHNVEFDNIEFDMRDGSSIIGSLGPTTSTINDNFFISESHLSLTGGGILYDRLVGIDIRKGSTVELSNMVFSAPNINNSYAFTLIGSKMTLDITWINNWSTAGGIYLRDSSKVVQNGGNITLTRTSTQNYNILYIQENSVYNLRGGTFNGSDANRSIVRLGNGGKLYTIAPITNGTGVDLVFRNVGYPTNPFAYDTWSSLPSLPSNATTTLVGRAF